MDPAPVSIIIPNYYGEQILGQTLASVVEAADAYPGKCEIIVVDDASQDGSVKFIAENFPAVKVVRHEVNKGFAEAVHSGVRTSVYEIVILLNSDVRPHRDFIEPLMRWFKQEDTFSVSPLVLDHLGQPHMVSWNLVKIVRGKMRRRKWNIEEVQRLGHQRGGIKSLYASGGSVACRKQKFLELGGFLPLYKPFYSEDLDLGIRAWRRGWQTFFDPESKVVHDHQQATIGRFYSEREVRLVRHRNRFFSLWLHLSTSALIFSHIPWTLFRLPWRLFRMDTVYAIALFRALFNLGEVLKLRGELNREQNSRPLERIIEDLDPSRAGGS